MRVTGLIVEYNPFHNGHLHHLTESRRLTCPDLMIAVMSGNFVQRGEPAIVDKWQRTEMALLAGVDVVIELPVIFACASAREFANGAILSLLALGASDFVFGAEHAHLEDLKLAAQIAEDEPCAYKETLHHYLDRGQSFARARSLALSSYGPQLGEIAQKSNNILAISYLQALRRHQSTLTPHAVIRKGESYNSENYDTPLASATAIRNALQNLQPQDLHALPDTSQQVLSRCLSQGIGPITLSNYDVILLALLRRASVSALYDLFDIEKGLPHRLKRLGLTHTDIEAFITEATSRRYPRTRIQRLLIHLLLGIDNNLVVSASALQTLPYARVLGLRKEKTKVYKQWRDTLPIALIERTADHKLTGIANAMYQLDLRATDIYMLGCPAPQQRIGGKDYVKPPVLV